MTTALQLYRMLQEIYVLFDSVDQHVLSTFDLNSSQYRALLHLDTAERQRLTDLSERLLLDKSTITRIVDQLEQEGLVQRIADPDDRRAQHVILTPAGNERLDLARAAHERSIEYCLSTLGKTEQQQLGLLLDKLRADMHVVTKFEGGTIFSS